MNQTKQINSSLQVNRPRRVVNPAFLLDARRAFMGGGVVLADYVQDTRVSRGLLCGVLTKHKNRLSKRLSCPPTFETFGGSTRMVDGEWMPQAALWRMIMAKKYFIILFAITTWLQLSIAALGLVGLWKDLSINKLAEYVWACLLIASAGFMLGYVLTLVLKK